MSSDELTTIAQKAARGGLFLFIGNASSTVILAVGAILVARLLGPFSYGLYTLTVAIPVLLVALADAGMNFALVRLPARRRSEGDHARANRLVKLGFSSNSRSAQRPQSSAMLAQRSSRPLQLKPSPLLESQNLRLSSVWSWGVTYLYPKAILDQSVGRQARPDRLNGK